MRLKDNFAHKKRVEKVAFKLDVSKAEVEFVIDTMYKYIAERLEAVEKEGHILTEEEFNNKFKTIHIPSLGYLKPNYKKYVYMMKNKLKKDGKK